MARDLDRVWRAPTTGHADRKNLIRMLVREIAVTPVEIPRRATCVKILWHTGQVSELLVARPSKGEAVTTPPALIERVRDLAAQGKGDAEIAAELNSQGVRSGRGRSLTIAAIAWIRWRNNIACMKEPKVTLAQPMPERREDGLYSVRGVARELGVTVHIVRYWQSRGLLVGQRGRYNSWWFSLDEQTRKQLQEAKACGYGPKTIPNPENGRKVHYA
jgi:hypothetical protein